MHDADVLVSVAGAGGTRDTEGRRDHGVCALRPADRAAARVEAARGLT
jgi:hypothetical protein